MFYACTVNHFPYLYFLIYFIHVSFTGIFTPESQHFHIDCSAKVACVKATLTPLNMGSVSQANTKDDRKHKERMKKQARDKKWGTGCLLLCFHPTLNPTFITSCCLCLASSSESQLCVPQLRELTTC